MPWDQVPYAEGLTRCEVPGGTIYRYSSGHITFAPEPKAAAPKLEEKPQIATGHLYTQADLAMAAQVPMDPMLFVHSAYANHSGAAQSIPPSVPREPTEAMLDAARQWWLGIYATHLGPHQATGVWQVMFNAASPKGVAERQNKPPVQQQTGVNREGQS